MDRAYCSPYVVGMYLSCPDHNARISSPRQEDNAKKTRTSIVKVTRMTRSTTNVLMLEVESGAEVTSINVSEEVGKR